MCVVGQTRIQLANSAKGNTRTYGWEVTAEICYEAVSFVLLITNCIILALFLSIISIITQATVHNEK
jgi:hypothetical protein